AIALLHAHGHGFLDKNVTAHIERLKGEAAMRGGRGQDVNHIWLELRHFGQGAEGRRDIVLLRHSARSLGIQVGDGYNLHPVKRPERANVIGANITCSYQAHTDSFWRRLIHKSVQARAFVRRLRRELRTRGSPSSWQRPSACGFSACIPSRWPTPLQFESRNLHGCRRYIPPA